MPLFTPPPASASWPRIDPTEAGFDPVRLAEAVAFAAGHETPWSRNIEAVISGGYFEGPPDNEILGRTAPRGGPNGVIVRGGRIVADWGDTHRVDMTFSVAKSYLGILTGIAVDRGLVPDIDEPVAATVDHPHFVGPRHARITWRHLLNLTSEWEGSLWGKAERIDRNRNLSAEGKAAKGALRLLQEPGAHWEYNDVRVNLLAFALLLRFGEALPSVFARTIMKPIGASTTWSWEGYRTSFVDLGGDRVQSVSGGGHWGGGVFISALDQARIGLLMLRQGVWGDTRLLSADWIREQRQPSILNVEYGLLWWLNTDGRRYSAGSPESYFASGAGGNLTWIDPANDWVVVLRWTDPLVMNGFVERMMRARV